MRKYYRSENTYEILSLWVKHKLLRQIEVSKYIPQTESFFVSKQILKKKLEEPGKISATQIFDNDIQKGAGLEIRFSKMQILIKLENL